MKLQIVGASTWVNRMFEACGNYQWAREFLKNSLEANASKVEFGIEWQAVEKYGCYRRTVSDDGLGMDAEELWKFFSTLGEGAKKIGGVHDNFGVGAKIAALPWNPQGVVVISYRAGKASMIWITLNAELNEYELIDFQTQRGLSTVIDPCEIDWRDDEVDWCAVAPEWAREHGTTIVLLGSSESPDTVLGNPLAGEKDIKGLSVYLNTRFWDLSALEVKVVELRSEKKNSWPSSPNDTDDARRPNNRTINGAKYYLNYPAKEGGCLGASGVLSLDEGRVGAEWYLWEGDRPHIHSYAKKQGYIAVRYQDELFELTSHKVNFRWFGIVEGKVQLNLTIILQPQLYNRDVGYWGVHPDQSRNRLIFTGKGEKGVGLPLSDWGAEFADNMPEPILEAIRNARGELSGSIQDESYRKRLQDKFGSRWAVKRLVPARERKEDGPMVNLTDEPVDVFPPGEGRRHRSSQKKQRTVRVSLKAALLGDQVLGREVNAPVDVPKYRLGKREDFETPWHLALWDPRDPEGPTVLINADSPILEEIVKYHQEQYPDVYAEEVEKTVHEVFGEVAACKIAHTQKLIKMVPEEQLDADYRSDKALTVALMGLLAEESLIAQRLGRLGRKKSAA